MFWIGVWVGDKREDGNIHQIGDGVRKDATKISPTQSDCANQNSKTYKEVLVLKRAVGQ